MNIGRLKPSLRKQQIWVCIVAGLFVCDFILCGYLPLHQRQVSLQEARAQQRRTLSMGAAQGEELAALQARLDEARHIVERFDRLVPPDRAFGAFLLRVTGLMNECGLSDQAVIPGTEVESGDLGCIPIQITCKGTMANLFAFFARFQALDRLVRIEQVTLENDAAFTGQLRMHAAAAVFYQLKSLKTTQEAARADVARGADNGA